MKSLQKSAASIKEEHSIQKVYLFLILIGLPLGLLSQEDWNNRLRIANIWVAEEHRFQGIGKALIAKAIEIGKSGGQRALVLETQSCNDPAIRFYLSCGFNLIGLDSTHYQNDDIQRSEVRLEFGLIL